MSDGVQGKRILLVLSVVAALAVMVVIGVSPAQAAITVRETPDRTWNTNGTVFTTELSDDGKTLYIGGKFTRVRQNPPSEAAGASFAVNSVAAIDVATGEAISGWNPKVTGGTATVHALEVKGGKVYIGGNFTAVGAQPRQNLAAVDATNGTVDPWAPAVTAGSTGLTPWVYALLANDSKLYVGGVFSNVAGKPRAKLAAFNLATGALDPTWTPKASSANNVRELEFDSAGTTIFVAGRFTSITGSNGTPATRESVARLYADTGNVHPWAIPLGADQGIGQPQVGFDLTATPTRLYGGFGLGPNFAAAFRLDNGDVGTRVWRFSTVGDVQTVELSRDGGLTAPTRLFLGGHFGTNELEQQVCRTLFDFDGEPLSGLVSVNPATGAPLCDWVPQLSPSKSNGNGSWDITDTGEALWVGGGFTQVTGGQPPVTVDQPNIARFDY